ncbi:MAG: hypothetical protein U0P30_04420 [Vicinamibacterales bacterium]
MTTLPLHPAIVHLPLGLALLMPLAAAGFAWAVVTGRVRRQAWITVIALQALLVGAGFVAMNTGGTEEERVEAVVPESAIEAHEERAETFMWAAGATLALTVLVAASPVAAAVAPLAAASTLGTMAVAGLALWVGHAGGQLVYQQGAASVYARTTPAGVSAPAMPGRSREDGDRDDDDRR